MQRATAARLRRWVVDWWWSAEPQKEVRCPGTETGPSCAPVTPGSTSPWKNSGNIRYQCYFTNFLFKFKNLLRAPSLVIIGAGYLLFNAQMGKNQSVKSFFLNQSKNVLTCERRFVLSFSDAVWGKWVWAEIVETSLNGHINHFFFSSSN